MVSNLKVTMIGAWKNIGGITVHMSRLGSELRERGHEVFIVPLKGGGITSTPYYYSRLDHSHIVHVHGLKDLPPITAAFLSTKMFRAASIATAHGFKPPYWYYSGPKRHYVKNTLSRFNGLISVSNFVRRRLASFTGEDPPSHYTIYNGVDVVRFDPQVDASGLREKLGLQDKVVVLFIGRLAPMKGVEYLIRAIPEAIRENDRVRLLVCGKGETEDQLVALTKQLNLQEYVTFRGFIPSDMLTSYYSLSDMVAVPSTYDPMPLVLLEAMSMKKPLIASKVGGIPEIVKHEETGWIVPPADPSALASAIVKVSNDQRLARKLGDKGRKAVEERYTWKKVAEFTERVYYHSLNN